MKGFSPGRYALWSAVVAVSAGLVLIALTGIDRGLDLRWSVFGWSIMTLAAVGGGTWAVSQHGNPGPGFLAALGACMLARLIAGAVGAAAAAAHGVAAVWAYLAGLGVTYVPLQVFETGWFVRRTRSALRRAG